MKKLLALALAVMLVMSLATTAFADETTGNSITITGTAGHTYEVYQIFTGDLSGKVLSNIVWGNGVSDAGQTYLGNAAETAATLSDTNIKNFQAEVDQYLTNPTVMAANGTTYTLTNLTAGYYLIKDKDGTQENNNGTYTAYIIKVVGAVSVKPKDSVPTVDKSVTKQDQNADDFEIGDTVTFILKATLGDNVTEYTSYKLVFHDTLSAGLTYQRITSVTVDGKTITSGYDVARENGKLTITFDNVLAETVGATNKSAIVVTYTATLNSDAEIGKPGNSNKVKLEYSNNPNWDSDGDEPTGETPEDEVLVFTYELDVTKVDGANTGKKLSDAEFVLLNSDKTKVATVVDGKLTGWVSVPTAVNGTITWPTNTTLTSGTDGLFKIAGLDDGTYYLRETKAPDGYNLLTSDVKVVIDATLNTADDQAALTALTISVNNGTAANGDVDSGIVNATVENNAGATLPETGGIGTTIFYTLGSILVLAAVVLLVTKKRMASAK